MTKRPNRDGLSPKKRAFVAAYLTNGFNATQAALAAGCARRGARVRGHELLHHPKVQAIVEAELASRGASKERVLLELIKTALEADIADFEGVGEGKTLKDLRAEGVDTRQVREIKIRRVGGKGGRRDVEEISLKLVDRQRALEHLSRLLGLDNKPTDANPHADDRLARAHAAMVAATTPRGTAAADDAPGAVQDHPSGPSVGKDGTGEATPGDGAG